MRLENIRNRRESDLINRCVTLTQENKWVEIETAVNTTVKIAYLTLLLRIGKSVGLVDKALGKGSTWAV